MRNGVHHHGSDECGEGSAYGLCAQLYHASHLSLLSGIHVAVSLTLPRQASLHAPNFGGNRKQRFYTGYYNHLLSAIYPAP